MLFINGLWKVVKYLNFLLDLFSKGWLVFCSKMLTQLFQYSYNSKIKFIILFVKFSNLHPEVQKPFDIKTLLYHIFYFDIFSCKINLLCNLIIAINSIYRLGILISSLPKGTPCLGFTRHLFLMVYCINTSAYYIKYSDGIEIGIIMLSSVAGGRENLTMICSITSSKIFP